MGLNQSQPTSSSETASKSQLPTGSTLDPSEFQALQSHYNKVSSAASSSTPFIEALLADLNLPATHQKIVENLFGIEISPPKSMPNENENESLEESAPTISFEQYREAAECLLHGSSNDVRERLFRAGKSATFEQMFALLQFCSARQQGEEIPKIEAQIKCANDNAEESSLVLGMKQFAKENDKSFEEIDLPMFNQWCERHVPAMHQSLKGFIRAQLIQEKPTVKEGETESTGAYIQGSSVRKETLFALWCCSDVFKQEWTKLFDSEAHGMSYENLNQALIGYGGPTLIVITDTLGNSFGALSHTVWKESPLYYGDTRNMLFSLWPVFSVYRARHSHQHAEDTENYQYLNNISRTKSHGIGFGGKKEAMRIWLSGTLEDCKAHSFDLTYEQGPLRTILKASDVGEEVVEHDDFTPARIEIFGFGGEKALEAQKEARQEKEEIVSSRRQVDKKQFIQSEFDKEYLFGTTFKASNEKQER